MGLPAEPTPALKVPLRPKDVFDEASAAVLGRDEVGAGGGMPFSFMNESETKFTSFQWCGRCQWGGGWGEGGRCNGQTS